MKKQTLMILALAAGGLLNAENAQNAAQPAAQKPQVCASNAAKACELTVEEQAFSAKLNDQNRKAFAEKLNGEQRKAVMASVKNGGSADEAVAKLASSHVASAEKAPAQSKAQAK
jgi:hypothetical protein